MSLLEVSSLGISFGGLRAVDEFNLNIEKGELYGLIGPNGAGKTTVFNMLTGIYKPTDGKIFLDGKDITGKKTADINKAGIARTFQNIRLFGDQSVLDNVKIGLHNSFEYGTGTGILRLPKYFSVEKEMDKKALEILSVFGLDKEADVLASNLPYGKQRQLEIARALATNPSLLLLDVFVGNGFSFSISSTLFLKSSKTFSSNVLVKTSLLTAKDILPANILAIFPRFHHFAPLT